MRPPVMCCGCPHRGRVLCLKAGGRLRQRRHRLLHFGRQRPLKRLDASICMGASVSALHGYNKARGPEAEKKSVAVIGDSTFAHSGITSLIDIAYNRSNSVVIVLDNSITGMTGPPAEPHHRLQHQGRARRRRGFGSPVSCHWHPPCHRGGPLRLAAGDGPCSKRSWPPRSPR